MIKLAIGCTKAGLTLKKAIVEYLESQDYLIDDLGMKENGGFVPYYDSAAAVAKALSEGKYEKAIIICGTGAGSVIIANKFKNVFAVYASCEYEASRATIINQANCLCLGEWLTPGQHGIEIVKAWLNATAGEGFEMQWQKFLNDGVDKVKNIDSENLSKDISVNEKRKSEIRSLLKLSVEDIKQKADKKLFICGDIDQLHKKMAREIADEIIQQNKKGELTRLIVPVGPTGQYPYLAEMINKENISLKNVWLFFMDEYCGDEGKVIPKRHPLSFKGEAERLFFKNLGPNCDLLDEQVIFPNENNIGCLTGLIEEVGGIDTSYGGIGIHGHIAFNEPSIGVAETSPRKVRLNDFTVTINAVRSHVGGNIECFPRHAYTLGMKQILEARRIRLYCRNGCGFDWANTVLRLALFGEPGEDYPVTYIRHKNYIITTDKETLACPEFEL